MMRTAAVVVLVCTLAACAGLKRGPRLPQLSDVQEFVIPWENAFPNDIAVDRDGVVWFTDRLNHTIGRFDVRTQEFMSVKTPTARSAPYGIIAGPDGALWFALSVAARIGRIDTATGAITEYPLEGVTRGGPHMLTWHGDRIWFTMREGAAYGWLDPATGRSVLYPLPQSRPYSITATRGAIWFNSFENAVLFRVDASSGEAERFELRRGPPPAGLSADSLRAWYARTPIGAGEIRRITSDDAGNVWFTDLARGRLGRYEPATATLREFDTLARGGQTYGITRTSRGLLWFAENGPGNIVVFDPVTEHRVHVTAKQRGGTVRHIVVDEKRGRAWLPMSDRGVIGLVEYR